VSAHQQSTPDFFHEIAVIVIEAAMGVTAAADAPVSTVAAAAGVTAQLDSWRRPSRSS